MHDQVSSRSSLACFPLHPIATACAVLLSLSSIPAMAQDAVAAAAAPATTTSTGDGSIATVKVSGIRRGIEDAISVKKDATSIVESISAEDIGKLPDTSIAESIARLPGLAAQRVAGRAQVISVRGLSPDFATTLLNGREQVSTGDNRSVEFDQYPSELLSAVTVHKTPDAGLVGQGLSGTIDMQTVRPLSFPGRTISFNVRGEKNSLGKIADAKDHGHRVSASYIDQFANRTIGVALGVANMESPILDNETGTYEPFDQTRISGVPAGTYVTAGVKALAKSGRLTRTGVIGVLEYRPSRMWTSTLDVFASNFKQVDTNNQFEVNLGGFNGNNNPIGFNYASTNIVDNTLIGGTATGAYPLVRGQHNHREDRIRTAGWGNRFNFGDWSLVVDANYSQAKRDETYLENNLQLQTADGGAFNDPLMTVGWRTGQFAHLSGQLDYSNPAILHTGNSIYGYGKTYSPHLKDRLASLKVAANLPAPAAIENYLSGFDVGVNYSDRTKTKRQPEGQLFAKGTPTISSDLLHAPVDLGFAGAGIVPSWNVPAVIAKYFDPINYSLANNAGTISRAWDVTEKITTAFARANIDSEIGGYPVRGNIGAQIIRTDQSSESLYADAAGVAHPIESGKKYTDVLPSMNLAISLDDSQTLRFSLAKQIARPRVDQLNAGFNFSVASGTRLPNGSGGNSKLDPWRAKAFDVSYEKYFDKKGYVALAGFYKKLDTYIYTFSETRDFSQFTPGTNAISNFGQYTTSYNGDGGILKGAELTVSVPLELLTPALDGFGVLASSSWTESGIDIKEVNSAIGKIQLPGLSRNVSNITLYYEKAGFSTRVSGRRRSDYVGEIGNFAGDRQLRFVHDAPTVDAQVGYTFNDGRYKGLGLLLQVNNLNNAAYETYANRKDRQLEYAKYGRTVLFGVNYKF
ncbi:TonB-dependent receptor [Pseudoduganella sp. SL102]|uniref:TonB-dependent receptor n=1 Tax=Pseudoduganella sp. SL102 TaxID=2995154 RepID=UPI00248B40BA|nr:TonB-dependent receptor [Pseudoduganella sp. SL102]WBS02552.1 TonB-dependent receptor [Pseudoduganella sp. SL102]